MPSFSFGIALREDIVTTVRVIAENRDAHEGLLVDCLRLVGYETLQAELLVSFVPLGLARAIVSRLRTAVPIELADHVWVLKGDQKKKVPLIRVPEFVDSLNLGEETFTTGVISKEYFAEAAGFSVELNLINQALIAGDTISKIAAPILLRLGQVPGFDDWYNQLKPFQHSANRC